MNDHWFDSCWDQCLLLLFGFYCGPTGLPVHWYAVLRDATVVKPRYCYY
jgi:hypothetical protein